MISKNLHFIWIGPQVKYVNFCIQNFKLKNPDFNINYIHYLPIQLEVLYFQKKIKSEIDKLIFDLIDDILNQKKYQNLILKKIKFFKMFGTIPFLQLFCDILRLELINTYGGIYVDCDTYPIKPFDEKLLAMENFCVYDKIENFHEANNYFIGSNKKQFIDDYFVNTTILDQTNNFMIKKQVNKPLEFQIRRIKFFNCKLTDNDFLTKNSNYIEHYSDFSWGKGKVQFTKFDKIFN